MIVDYYETSPRKEEFYEEEIEQTATLERQKKSNKKEKK